MKTKRNGIIYIVATDLILSVGIITQLNVGTTVYYEGNSIWSRSMMPTGVISATSTTTASANTKSKAVGKMNQNKPNQCHLCPLPLQK